MFSKWLLLRDLLYSVALSGFFFLFYVYKLERSDSTFISLIPIIIWFGQNKEEIKIHFSGTQSSHQALPPTFKVPFKNLHGMLSYNHRWFEEKTRDTNSITPTQNNETKILRGRNEHIRVRFQKAETNWANIGAI